MNEYDRQNVRQILTGHGDWFGAVLLRTIALGSAKERGLLFISYPVEVQLIANLDWPPGTHQHFRENIRNLHTDSSLFDREIERLYVKADAINRTRLKRCFSRFE